MNSFVDPMSSIRWTKQMLDERIDHDTKSDLIHLREHVLLRRSVAFALYLLGQMLPAGPTKDAVAPFGRPLSPDAIAELTAAAATLDAADVLAAAAKADAALLTDALDYEDVRTRQAALPPVPVPDPDTGITPDDPLAPPDRAAVEAQRAALQSQMDAFAQATKDLVATRDAYRASLVPAPAKEATPA